MMKMNQDQKKDQLILQLLAFSAEICILFPISHYMSYISALCTN